MQQSLEQIISTAYSLGLIPKGVESHIKSNLNSKFKLRPYQVEAFERFNYYNTQYPNSVKPTQLLFHMATGSGKTLVMAGLILDLYEKGYRNFIFFVHSKSIIEKTRDNFLNSLSSKYLFNDTVSFSDRRVKIKEVENFEALNDEDINIVFTTIQGLHRQLNTPRENSLTYEDFEDKKIVLLSDEAHHINAETKKRKHTKDEVEAIISWEGTVNRIFNANPDNYLLEFTATVDLNHPDISTKYQEKLLFDYPLKQFRIDKYSKEVQVLQTDLQPFERALQSVLLSQYRQKVFENNQLHIKPVIMFKSKTIKESQEFYNAFVSGINSLTVNQLEKIKTDTSNPIMSKVFNYLEQHNITLENLVLELKNDFSKDKCIAVDSKHDSEEKQLVINSLEDENNEYRAVFAVDKLNEGWDVLNLFDIVRLYDTQSTGGANKGKVGKTTMSEAQLIGRGARYYPFKVSDDQPLYKRKYDDDIENDLRIGEELYYHSAHNPRYISELNKALQQIGIKAPKTVQKRLVLKDSFKDTDFYKSGKVYVNKRIAHDRKDIHALEQSIRTKIYKKKFVTGKSAVSILIDGMEPKQLSNDTRIYNLKDFSKPIIRKALHKLPFYRFSNLQRYFPHLNSMSEFINDDKFLNTIKIEFIGNAEQVQNPTNEMKLEATVTALDEISKLIPQGYTKYRGTQVFYPESVAKKFGAENGVKVLNFSIDQNNDNGGKGIGQSETVNQDLHIDLSKEDWYVFNDNYGTSEEKYLVKFIKGAYQSLKEKYKVYLLRNEKHITIYTFDEGLAFQPDFILFLIEKETKNSLLYQVFIEPKGDDRLSNKDSQIKEKFLMQISSEYKLDILFKNQEYKLVGMPLYNEANTKTKFNKAFNELSNSDISSKFRPLDNE
ncbi:DEAD/DEAH box helicase [Flavobacteriaceae bacterium Ap0902]|nr:DEAD/DEAH box helicase [Flavobacteriaceae bacterium Ap0902]